MHIEKMMANVSIALNNLQSQPVKHDTCATFRITALDVKTP